MADVNVLDFSERGYSVVPVSEDRAILFSPEDVRSPITGAYRGKRRVAGFDPRELSEGEVSEIADLDFIARNYPELGPEYFGKGTDLYALNELAWIFTHGETR